MEGMNYAYRWCLGYGLIVAAILFLTARYIGGFFTDNQQAIETVNMHLSLVPWSYALLGMSMVSTSAFNAVGKPTPGMIVSMCRTRGVYAPMAFLLAAMLGLQGVFLAAFLANIVSGSLGWVWFRAVFKPYLEKEPLTETA